MTLPCHHSEQITEQVQPTIDLLTNLNEWYPQILIEHDIQPSAYHDGLVFRSAVESIRGTYIASSTTRRQRLVEDVLINLQARSSIVDYEYTASSNRYDFVVALERDPDYFTAVEVKGGEGNSINISERPIWAREFCVWCHLDGAIVNDPAHGAHSIVNRITRELVKRKKQVDVVVFKDILCGTKTRPCPKYPGREREIGLAASPDVFLFPQRVPTFDDPEPPVHDLETLKFPQLILDLFGVPPEQYTNHTWEVHVRLEALPDNKARRQVEVWHRGSLVDESSGRSWKV